MMKTVNRFLMLAVMALSFVGFAGCGDDDDDGTPETAAGSYKGTLKLWNVLPVATDVVIPVNRKDGNNSQVEFPIDFQFKASMGATEGPAVQVKGNCVNEISLANNTCTIKAATGNGFTVTVTQPGAEPVSIPDLSVTIEGTITGKTANLKINVPLQAAMLTALGDFPGKEAIIGQLQPDEAGNVSVQVNFTGERQ